MPGSGRCCGHGRRVEHHREQDGAGDGAEDGAGDGAGDEAGDGAGDGTGEIAGDNTVQTLSTTDPLPGSCINNLHACFL